MAEERDLKVKVEQLAGCDDNLWYVTDCELRQLVGMRAPTLDELKAKVERNMPGMIIINGVSKTSLSWVVTGPNLSEQEK